MAVLTNSHCHSLKNNTPAATMGNMTHNTSDTAVAASKRLKTKIVYTLGPATTSVQMIRKLLKDGMNIARFNFSHGSHEYHQETVDNIHTAMQNT